MARVNDLQPESRQNLEQMLTSYCEGLRDHLKILTDEPQYAEALGAVEALEKAIGMVFHAPASPQARERVVTGQTGGRRRATQSPKDEGRQEGEGHQSDEGIQGRHAPQRESERAGGEEPQAGHRDHALGNRPGAFEEGTA